MTGGYVDLQVNGFAGVDFNDDDLTATQFAAACEAMAADGVVACCPTLITAPLDSLLARIERVAFFSRDHSIVAGLHVEGPFVSGDPGYVGAHPRDAIRRASVPVVDRILKAGGGAIRLVTLAPEQDAGAAVTAHLVRQGIVVAAGHTNATLDELDAAIEAGLSLVTHLGNACPPSLPRHDNIIQRCLSRRDRLTISLIADGFHLPPFVLANMLDLLGDRAIVVSDATAAAGLGPGRYRLGGQPVIVEDDLVPWSADRTHFVGSAMPMSAMTEVLAALGRTHTEIDDLVSNRPRRILGLSQD